MLKKILSTILVLSMVLTLSVCLFSCDDDKGNTDGENSNQGSTDTTPEKVLYTITVVDEEGTPIKGVEIEFAPKGGTAVPFKTDAEGKATLKTDKELSITVKKIPAGYSYDKINVSQKLDSDNNVTITLTTLPPFIIRVVDQNGNPIEGVKVQMCDEAGSCRMPVETEANGEATYRYEEGSFHAQLTSLPEGYSVDDLEAYYNFVDGVAVITLTKN